MNIKEQKDQIRKLHKEKRRKLTKDQVDSQSALICQNFLDNILPDLISNYDDPIFSIYIQANNEVSSDLIIKHFKKNSITFCLPKITDNDVDLEYILFNENLEYKNNDQYKNLIEPLSGNLTTPNILILPLVAFDKNKNRVGMSKGFIDRSIAKLKTENSQIHTVGLGYKAQLHKSTIPTEKHDQKLDIIVSSDFIIR